MVFGHTLQQIGDDSNLGTSGDRVFDTQDLCSYGETWRIKKSGQ